VTHPAIEPLPGTERLGVPAHLMDGAPGDHYVMKVVGDRMAEAWRYSDNNLPIGYRVYAWREIPPAPPRRPPCAP